MMRALTTAAACLVLCAAGEPPVERREIGDLILEDIPAEAEALGQAVADAVKTRPAYRFLDWRLAGGGYTFLRSGNLYRATAPHGEFKKVADFPERIENPRLAKVCGTPAFVFSSDKDGDEYDLIYAVDGTKKPARPALVSPESARNAHLHATHDGALIAYASAARGSGKWRLIVQEPCPGAERRVLQTSHYRIIVHDFTPDGKRLILSRQDDSGFVLYSMDVAAGDTSEIARLPEPVEAARSGGRDVVFATNAWSEFVELYAAPIEGGGEPAQILGAFGHDVDEIALSRDRRKLAVVLNLDGSSKVVVFDIKTRKPLGPGMAKPLGVVGDLTFTPDGAKLAFAVSLNAQPERTGIYDWETDTFTPWSGGVDPASPAPAAVPERIAYPTFDGRRIPALLYLPSAAHTGARVPVVVAAHGGPESQWRPRFNRLYNHFVTNLGVAVVQPDIRGSTGYGKAFEQLDETVRREDAVKDIGALLDWIAADPRLDENKVAIVGGSYGGFVAMASAVTYPDRFRGAVSRVGIADFKTFLANTERYRLANRRLEYGDERNPEVAAFFDRISPLRRAAQVQTPMLIIQGANDPRVPRQQAEDLVAAVRAGGVRVGYLLANDEGHRFENPKNRNWRDGAQVEFIRRVLIAPETAAR